MAGLNETKLIGNLVANAELRRTQSGQPVTSMRIACNERYYSNGETRERVEYVNLVLWGKRGEALVKAEALGKGQSLFVQGRLQTREYTPKDNIKRYVTEVVIGNLDKDLQLLARRGSQVPPVPQDVPPPSDDDYQQATPKAKPPKTSNSKTTEGDDFSE